MSWSLSILITYLYIIIYANSTKTNICIWGRTDNSTTYINGLYTYHPADGGLDYYEKLDSNCSANDLYLYLKKNTWHIGPNLGSTNSTVICEHATYIDSPDQCGSLWKINEVIDVSVKATKGSCPVLKCTQLEVVYYSNTHCLDSPDDCCGPFVKYDSENYDNVYFKKIIDGGRYLYFSTNDFRWICSKSPNDLMKSGQCQNLATSDTIDAYCLDPKWYSLQPQDIRKFSWSSNRNKTVYIECSTIAPTPTPTKSPIFAYKISGEELGNFKQEIKQAFDDSGNTKPLLASSVRLVFNDCIGPREWVDDDEIANATYSHKKPFEYNTVCDGCINYVNDEFHDGLKKLAIDKLEYIYDQSSYNWNDKMSRSDFWMAVGTVAIEYGIELSSVSSSTEYGQYPYFFGRRSCTESPMININETKPKVFDFGSYDILISFFADNLNFTSNEALVLIGAHTLGTAHQLYSGFSASWTDKIDEFDNSYYTALLDYEWQLSDNEAHWTKSDGLFNMLDEDMFIAYDLSDYYNVATKRYTAQCVVNKAATSSLTYDTCPIRTTTKSVLDGYKADNEMFLKNFKKVWVKMVTIGYDTHALYTIESHGSTPTPDTTQADIGYVKSCQNVIIVALTAIYCVSL